MARRPTKRNTPKFVIGHFVDFKTPESIVIGDETVYFRTAEISHDYSIEVWATRKKSVDVLPKKILNEKEFRKKTVKQRN